MSTIFRYFWFFAAIVMGINVGIWRRRLMVVVDRGVATRVEVDHFIGWVAAWFIGGPLIVGLIALGAGWSSPFCAGMLSFADVPRSVVSLLNVSGWAVLLWWLWRGNGADFLARVAPALAQRQPATRQFSPSTIRLGLTAFVVFCALGSAIMWRVMPRDPQFDCPVAVQGT